MGGAKAGEGGDEVYRFIGAGLFGKGACLCRFFYDAETITQPLDGGACDKN